MTATVKFINRQTCQVPYSKIGEVGDIQIKESMICAKGNHREGNDTCLVSPQFNLGVVEYIFQTLML